MKAAITGETDGLIGVNIRDNNDAEHVMDVRKEDGEIPAHKQDGYPDDPAERTDAENEAVGQSRRYARYYVLRERSYPTVEPWATPEGPAVAAAVIASLDTESFRHHFGDYYRQFQGTVESDVDPVVQPPDADGLVAYRQHVHLDVDLAELLGEPAARSLLEDVQEVPDPLAIAERIRDAFDHAVVAPEDLTIADTSEIGVVYQTLIGEGEREAVDHHPGSPAARLELSPIDAPWEGYLPVEGFQTLLIHHLLCQARDRHLEMGLEPPAGLRILGVGTFRQTVRNEHLELYEPVHYTDAEVEGYALPELGPEVEL